jgi:putative ABC transport system permease protein
MIERKPPLLARLLLGIITPKRDRQFLISDLAEEFEILIAEGRSKNGANIWYWHQVLASIPSGLKRKKNPSVSSGGHQRTTGRRGITALDSVLSDVRFALRTMIRRPGFVAIAVLTLGLGIGASSAIFSAVNSVTMRPLTYRDASQLVYLGSTWAGPTPVVTSIPDFIDWHERFGTLELLGAVQPTSLVIAGDQNPERMTVARVSPELFQVLGVAPALGPGFRDADFVTGAEQTVVLSARVWHTRWGGDRDVIGKTILSVGSERGEPEPVRIVGVMPEGFRSPSATGNADADMWIPLPVDADSYASSRTSRSLRLVGRMRAGITVAAVRQEANNIAQAMASEYPAAYDTPNGTLGIGVVSLLEKIVGGTGKALIILLGATGLLLLISCANVASLLLARVTDRGREIAVRTALGASRIRVVRQLLTESVLLGSLGTVFGVVVATAAVSTFRMFGPADFPRLSELAIDARVFAFAIVLAMATGILFGLMPALVGSKDDVTRALKESSGRLSGGMKSNRLRSVLVVMETALALVLLTGAGLLINSYVRLSSVNPGFDPDELLLSEVGLGPSYSSYAERASAFDQILERTRAIPGIVSASLIPDPPLSGYTMWTPNLFVDGAGVDGAQRVDAHLVGPDYFETMEIPVLQGRGISSFDNEGSDFVAVVSESAADRLWPNEDPVGLRFRFSPSSGSPWVTVVGRVEDVQQVDLAGTAAGEVYIAYAQAAWYPWQYVVIRTTLPPAAVAASLRQVLHEVDPSLPFDGVVKMTDRIAQTLNEPRFNAFVLFIFSLVALLLAAVGIYGTMLYSVAQRTHELGIRMALGAKSSHVLRMVLKQGMLLTLLGVGVGMAGAVALSRVLTSLVFGVTTTDPLTMAVVSIVLAVTALAACYVPARRATHVGPMEVLRNE